jgi:hypothetical protein
MDYSLEETSIVGNREILDLLTAADVTSDSKYIEKIWVEKVVPACGTAQLWKQKVTKVIF